MLGLISAACDAQLRILAKNILMLTLACMLSVKLKVVCESLGFSECFILNNSNELQDLVKQPSNA